MLEIKIDKTLLNNYRDYKIDLLEGKVQEDIMFKVLGHIISSGLMTLSEISTKLGDNASIVINVINGHVKCVNRKVTKIKSNDWVSDKYNSGDYYKYYKQRNNDK